MATEPNPAGQRLVCESCGSEIMVIKPCGCDPPDQSLRCCGKEMQPSVSKQALVTPG